MKTNISSICKILIMNESIYKDKKKITYQGEIMKKLSQFLQILLAVLISVVAPLIARAQTDESNYAFVVFETTVTKKGVETSDTNPAERRFYVSNVVEFPERDASIFRNAPKIADEYFTANVVEPLKAKGFLHQYYDDGIHINNSVVYRLDTRAEVEELRLKTLDELKEQNTNVFTFNWTRDKEAKGLETSQPMLFHHDSEQPLYSLSETKTPVPPTKPNDNLKPSVKKKTN